MTLCIALSYPLSLPGGVSVLVCELIRRLSSSYSITLVSPDRAEDIAAHPLSMVIASHIHWSDQRWTPLKARDFASVVRDSGAEIVHFHSGGNHGWGTTLPFCSPVPPLKALGIRCFSTVHLVVSLFDGYCGPARPLLFKLALLPMAWLGKMQVLQALEKEIAVSNHDLGKLQAWYFPWRRKLQRIYHSRLSGEDSPAGPTIREKTILNVGHLAFRKGQDVLLKAFAQVCHQFPDWKLILIGHDAEPACRTFLDAFIARHSLGDRVSLAGARNDAALFMASASIYVQPSIWEALGLALQEALWHGCPVVGSRVGGIPELIEEGCNGLLVEPGSVDELALALETLMTDHALRLKLSAEAHSSILGKGMTAEIMTRHYLSLYEAFNQRR